MDLASALISAILLTAFLVWRVVRSLPACSWWAYVGNKAAWSMVVGGGVYGLGVFDSRVLPDFSWLYMAIVIAGGFGITLVADVFAKRA